MGLIDSLIITSCVGFSGPAQEACNKALLAAAKEPVIGIETHCAAITPEDKKICKEIESSREAPKSFESVVNDSEQKYTKKAETKVRNYIGDTTFDYIGASVFVARSISSQSVAFGLPTLGLCDRAHADVGTANSLLKLEWDFR
jgi:hypothetical protein